MELIRWNRLLESLGLGDDEAEFQKLERAYAEPHRHYHTGVHLDDCLAQLDAAPVGEIPDPALVEVALWYHDAIYAPRSASNEADSAVWAVAYLASRGAALTMQKAIEALIMATLHDATITEPNAQWLVDIDLSILGRERAKYDAFESGVRAEYKWVPRFIFNRKRVEILGGFLDRERIYETAFFYERYEAAARANLARAIEQLTAS